MRFNSHIKMAKISKKQNKCSKKTHKNQFFIDFFVIFNVFFCFVII